MATLSVRCPRRAACTFCTPVIFRHEAGLHQNSMIPRPKVTSKFPVVVRGRGTEAAAMVSNGGGGGGGGGSGSGGGVGGPQAGGQQAGGQRAIEAAATDAPAHDLPDLDEVITTAMAHRRRRRRHRRHRRRRHHRHHHPPRDQVTADEEEELPAVPLSPPVPRVLVNFGMLEAYASTSPDGLS